MNLLFLIVHFCIIRDFTYLDSRLYKMDCMVYILATVYVENTFWISRFKKPLLKKIHSIVVKDYEDKMFATLTHTYLKSYLKIVGTLCCISLSLILIFPIITACFTNTELGDSSTLLWPTWIPWKANTVEGYTVTICLQLLFGTVLYSFAVIPAVLTVCFIAIIKGHVQRFRDMAKNINYNLEQRVNSHLGNKWNVPGKYVCRNYVEYDEILNQRLCKLIAFHQTRYR